MMRVSIRGGCSTSAISSKSSLSRKSKPPTKVGMKHLAASEPHGRANLPPIFQKIFDMPLFELVVVFRGIRTELHSFQDDLRLLFPSLACALVFLILILPVVHDLTNGRLGIR